MLSSISRPGEIGPEQEWLNGTEFSGYSDFPEFQLNYGNYGKGLFYPLSHPEFSEYLVEWKALQKCTYFYSILKTSSSQVPPVPNSLDYANTHCYTCVERDTMKVMFEHA